MPQIALHDRKNPGRNKELENISLRRNKDPWPEYLPLLKTGCFVNKLIEQKENYVLTGKK